MSSSYDLKNEAEVKEYLHNLGIEYRFGCFKEKNPDACHLLGDYLEAIKKDIPTAAGLYKDNCDERNYPKSCHKYAKYCLTGRGMPKPDMPSAFKYFKISCEQKEYNACLAIGMMLTGVYENIKPDFKAGLHYIKLACDNDIDNACHLLAGMYIKGIKEQSDTMKPLGKDRSPTERGDVDRYLLPQDMAKAYEYSLKACTKGNMHACANVSRMYRLGEGVEKNNELADQFRKIAVAMNEQYNNNPEIKFQQGLD